MRTLQPDGWAPPPGYANGVAARGTTVFVGGQIGWNARQQFETDDFVAQARQALRERRRRAARGGRRARAHHADDVVRRRQARIRRAPTALGAAYRAVIGRHFPAMTAVAVAGLIEDGAKVEIEVTAMLPDTGG